LGIRSLTRGTEFREVGLVRLQFVENRWGRFGTRFVV
jgi:hypothetical protein